LLAYLLLYMSPPWFNQFCVVEFMLLGLSWDHPYWNHIKSLIIFSTYVHIFSKIAYKEAYNLYKNTWL
jgi:hypothetical protein